jgi:NTE family protein
MENTGNDTALVMSGGGARAAYQVGFLRSLARRHPEVEPPIITGVSAGAINAAFLAARREPWPERVERLVELWSNLRTEDVFRVGPLGLFTRMGTWGLSLISGGRFTPRQHGMVDTSPLRDLLRRALREEDGVLPGVAENLRSGALRAVAITTSSYTTGQSVSFVEGADILHWQRTGRRSQSCRITAEHVLASSSLPLFFPAVRVEDAWYGDGGMRLTAPLSPAVHLGARKILAISTRYGKTAAEAEQPLGTGYPPPAQVAGVLLNSIFLDLFDGDALRLERINRLLENADAESRGDLRKIELLLLRPSQDLGLLANEYEARLPRTFRFLTRGLGTRATRSNDLLSLVMFQPDYLRRLIQLGEADAEERAEEIETFLGDGES